MRLKYSKLRFEVTQRSHAAITYHNTLYTTPFTILGGWIFWKSRQIGLMILGFYVILGKTMPIKSTPLTEEEYKLFEELND